MEVNITRLGEGLVKVTLVGRLDTESISRMEAEFISHFVPGKNNTIIDLSGVDFVASTGIRMLVSAAKNLRTGYAKLALYGAQTRVLQVFEAVALQKIVPICPTEADAVAAVTPPE